MEIIDNNGLLSKAYEDLIRATAQQNYWFGNFNCLEDFHLKEDVKIVVERKANGLPVLHRETINKLRGKITNNRSNDRTKEIDKLINAINNIVVLGEYKPSENNIYLYLDTINESASNQENLLVTTYIHEMLHAYFKRKGKKDTPYIYDIEEALAEAGMLVFLDQVKDSRLSWALQNVKNKWPVLKDYAKGFELYDDWKKRSNDLIKIIEDYMDLATINTVFKRNIFG